MSNASYNQPAEIPPELDRWNWGAFFLNWIWGIGNSTFIALLALVPFVNIVMIFVLGAKGSRWAWKNRIWRDAEHFRRTQRNWGIAGLVVWIVFFGGIAAMVVSLPIIMKGNDAYRLTMMAVQADPEVREALGDGIEASYWIGGSVNVDADGSGAARLSIPVRGSKAAGTVTAQGLRANGVWDMRLIVVTVDGSGVPIVLVDKDNLAGPGSSIGI